MSIVRAVSADSLKHLERIDRALVATGYRMLIVIEDVDRNTQDPGLVVELAAFLDRVRPMHSIGFLLTMGTTEGLSETAQRLCDYVEAIR